MLHENTVEQQTLEILKRLMQDSLLDEFVLVGGTALSLMIGHRKSIDLDFFTKNQFDASTLREELRAKYRFEVDFFQMNTLKGTINDVAVDFLRHNYPDLESQVIFDGIRMASLRDIAAMKVNAILNSGSRIKDFIDVAYLGRYLTMNEMVSSYTQKYPGLNEMMILKALLYFDDVDYSTEIVLLGNNDFSFARIKSLIQKMINHPNETLQNKDFN